MRTSEMGCEELSSPQPEPHDASEGDDVTLLCRFDPVARLPNITYYWVRTTESEVENVAFGELTLQSAYRITYAPNDGRFDLLITNVSYERDNGKFECRVRQGGTGRLFHTQAHRLVVLTQPGPPTVTPGHQVSAQEEREVKLTCSTSGGSPEPTIQWFREGSGTPLQAVVVHGKTREIPSVATLTFTPTKEDDGASFRCVVFNRAMPPGSQLDALVDLSVNYFPRVEVGPDNPLRVELDGTATMECKVDAKPQVNSVRWTRNGKYISSSFTHSIPGVTIQDAGKYTCIADNGLGRTGEKEVYLDVLYPPSVTLASKTYEAEEGGTVEIRCEVSSNPEPISIEWTMEGNNNFQQKGNTLVLRRVNADMAGTYVCRAANIISSSNGKSVERASSASVAVLVRHRPGRARINPDRPVAQEGTAVTLTCSAKPPGWPAPQFRWFRDNGNPDPKPTILATSNQYTIPSAHLGSEGVYRCQATNELGHGELASATLEVHQPPHFQNKLPLHMTKRSGEEDFSVSCSALGKPRPSIKWFKDNAEIKPDANLYEVKTDYTESSNAVSNVHSTLRFNGKARQSGNDLIPEDRGTYTCAFENEVKRVDSSMTLRIEHPPIAIKQQKKVAYDLSEVAEISCRVVSFPKPEFQWLYGSSTSPLQMSSDGHYDINTTSNNNDSYYSVLRIKNISSRDYGDYYCKVTNALGSIKPQIRLQPKGPPESPQSLAVQKVGPSYVTLKWEAGFNGGLSTKYFVLYRRVGRSAAGERCSGDRPTDHDWLEYDCGRINPCNVTRLEQHSSYTFKVKAVNTKGQSNFSNEIAVTTKVDEIPPPEQVTYDPSSRTLVFTAGATCLSLVGVAEGLGAVGGWQVVDTVQMTLSGTSSTVQEAVLEPPVKPSRSTGRHFAEPPLDELNPRLRLKLCLQPNQDICSNYTEAEIGTSYTKDSTALTTATLIAIVVSCLVFLLFLSLLFIFCRCKRNENTKETSKDYEMDSMRPHMSPQNQAPPPYYPSTGMENKALEHSMDLALEDSKNAVYATQGGYGYHVAPHQQPHPGQNMPSSEWVNMGYIENSYTNSNNGGSVNSQDSLWQMKMAAANNAGMPPHQIMDRQSNYGYDPIAHGGYGTIDDYAQYPHLPHQQQPPVDYNMRGSQNPSRQEYCSDPYASVHKPKKRMDQHIESPYHEVSGLPEAYGGEQDVGAEEKPPHLSLSYDESLESGYSTPNSRARRVIREIIV
ncbi:hypothetical protein O0L34_g11139 [Tuta absoluta]|nr:hypothetical protein O0L34_g11139 [Tuta absoluta]